MARQETEAEMISIDELIGKYPHLYQAGPGDNDKILEFYHGVTMSSGGAVLRYERGPDFFALIRSQGERSWVFYLKDDEGRWQGVAVLSIRRALVDGKPVRVGYGSDLRIARECPRELRDEWKAYYSEFMSRFGYIKDLEGCEYSVSAVLDGNKRMRDLMSHPDFPAFSDFGHLKIHNIFGRGRGRFRMLFQDGLRDLKPKARFARAADKAALRGFLLRQHMDHVLGYAFGPEEGDELSHRLSTWQGLTIENIIIVEDKQGRIIATMAPYDGSSMRRLVLGQMTFVRRLMGWLMPLVGSPAIREGREMHQCYLTALEMDKSLNEDQQTGLFELMLQFFYKSGRPKEYHNLVFIDAGDGHLQKALQGKKLLTTSVGTTLYEVHVSRPNQVPALPAGSKPAFEVAVL